MERRIFRSARRHGIPEEDIHHALDHSLYWHDLDEGYTMIVGAARNAGLIEVGVVPHTGELHVVHAMRARQRYLRGL